MHQELSGAFWQVPATLRILPKPPAGFASVPFGQFFASIVDPEGPNPMHEIKQVPADRMTPQQRRREIASLLANGIARLRSSESRPSARRTSESEFELGFSGHQRVHSDPANNKETRS